MKGFEGGKKEIRVQIEEQDRFIEIHGRHQQQRKSCMEMEGMTIFDKTTAPSCGFFGITQSRHYTILLPPPDTADEIKPRARCDL